MTSTTVSGLRDPYNGFIDRHETAWELAFALLALVYVAVGVAVNEPVPQEILVVDLALTAVFTVEFTTRLAGSYDRRAYLRGHWIDAIALVPAVRGVRMLGCSGCCGSYAHSPASGAPSAASSASPTTRA